ncbi:MAG: hypothetical protein AAF611_14475 [Bacteroidota bacterium]
MRYILLGFECITAFIGFLYYPKLTDSYWKWFSVYLIFIFFQELFWIVIFPLNFSNELLITWSTHYYNYVGLPIQYLFFYWLYAYKSLRNKTLFYAFFILYLPIVTILHQYLSAHVQRFTVNILVGSTLLTILAILEFARQIRHEDILKFRENKMFYINTGAFLFYVGTFPLSVIIVLKSSDEIIKEGFTFFMYYFYISNYIMYSLFSMSFIWGKKT